MHDPGSGQVLVGYPTGPAHTINMHGEILDKQHQLSQPLLFPTLR